MVQLRPERRRVHPVADLVQHCAYGHPPISPSRVPLLGKAQKRAADVNGGAKVDRKSPAERRRPTRSSGARPVCRAEGGGWLSAGRGRTRPAGGLLAVEPDLGDRCGRSRPTRARGTSSERSLPLIKALRRLGADVDPLAAPAGGPRRGRPSATGSRSPAPSGRSGTGSSETSSLLVDRRVVPRGGRRPRVGRRGSLVAASPRHRRRLGRLAVATLGVGRNGRDLVGLIGSRRWRSSLRAASASAARRRRSPRRWRCPSTAGSGRAWVARTGRSVGRPASRRPCCRGTAGPRPPRRPPPRR